MSQLPSAPNQDDETWAMRVEMIARTYDYPKTPNLAPDVQKALRRQRQPIVVLRLAQAGLILLLAVIAMTAAIPEVRAVVLDFLRLGAIEIFITHETPSPTLRPVVQPTQSSAPLEPTPLLSALNLPDEITLADARTRYPQLVKLPTYPSDLGAPDHVYDTSMLTFVWTEPNNASQVRLLFGILKSTTVGSKFYPWAPEMTRVNGNLAYWSTEPHLLMLFPSQVAGTEIQRQVNAHTLLWYDNVYTYRLETGGDEAEAVRIAESLQ